jgi:predicted 2-oxoglutarate/Fe(II)-dependent dioxygenase YbiX
VDLNFTSVRPPFFRKTPLNHETEIHADNETLDGCAKQGCENFDVSAVLYFNENFIGGELYFPTQKIRVPPKGGSFIAFPGDTRYAHGVLPIVEGIRYSAPMWFSIID